MKKTVGFLVFIFILLLVVSTAFAEDEGKLNEKKLKFREEQLKLKEEQLKLKEEQLKFKEEKFKFKETRSVVKEKKKEPQKKRKIYSEDTDEDEVKEKSSWYIGFGFGTGGGGYTVDEEYISFNDYFKDSEDPFKMSMNFGVGAILTPSIHLGFDISTLTNMGEMDGVSYSLDIYNYLIVMSYYPSITGFFIKAGLGASRFASTITYQGEDYYNGYSGTGALAGIGYNFWLGSSFNLGINLEYSAQVYDDEDEEAPESSNFWSIYVSFYWF
jgi:hypothetical protein